MGTQEGSIHRSLTKVLKPLVFGYEVNKSLNASTLKFDYFDKFTKPNYIESRIVTCYEPTEDQARLYEEACDKLFKV
jgi:hypothetical protein